MISLLKPLLDEGFDKADNDVLKWLPLAVLGLWLFEVGLALFQPIVFPGLQVKS